MRSLYLAEDVILYTLPEEAEIYNACKPDDDADVLGYIMTSISSVAPELYSNLNPSTPPAPRAILADAGK